jgi:hypothetical protein
MAAGGIMKSRSIALVVLLSTASVGASASADPLDWNVAIDTGGIWTAELGRDQPGDIRSLIGRTKGGRYDMYSINIIVNDMTRVELLTEMGEALPKVSVVSGRIVVKRAGWPRAPTNRSRPCPALPGTPRRAPTRRRAVRRRALCTDVRQVALHRL